MLAVVINRFIVVLSTYLRPRLVVSGIIAITESRVSAVFLGSWKVLGYSVSLEYHRDFQACQSEV